MSNEIERRLQLLEEKFEYQDNTVEELNQVIIEQQAQLDKLQEEFDKLKEEVAASSLDTPDINEKPPHY